VRGAYFVPTVSYVLHCSSCRVEDPPRIRRYIVDTSFVVVQGQLYVGNRNKHFRSSIDFRLRPNPDGRKSLVLQAPAYPEAVQAEGEAGAG